MSLRRIVANSPIYDSQKHDVFGRPFDHAERHPRPMLVFHRAFQLLYLFFGWLDNLRLTRLQLIDALQRMLVRVSCVPQIAQQRVVATLMYFAAPPSLALAAHLGSLFQLSENTAR
jgi:hypothetical protein